MQTKNQIAQISKILNVLLVVLEVLFWTFGTAKLSPAYAQGVIQAGSAEEALQEALQTYRQIVEPDKDYQITNSFITASYAYAVGEPTLASDEQDGEEKFVSLLARLSTNGTWESVAPNIVSASTFNVFLLSFPNELIDEHTKAFLMLPEQAKLDEQSLVTGQNFIGHKLPWPNQQTAVLTKKNNCALSGCSGTEHELQLDFDILGGGSSGDVYASKPGTVVFVKESSNQNCTVKPPDPCWKKANMVVIQHSDTEYSWYVHLAWNSVPVSVGSIVGFGTKIGVEGNTGFSSSVHLHFMTSVGHTSWTDPNDPNAAPWATSITATDFVEASWESLSVGSSYLSQNVNAKPGDANGDGKVDGLDYVIWLNNYSKQVSGGPYTGDFNNKGFVDGLDYVIWLNNYGK